MRSLLIVLAALLYLQCGHFFTAKAQSAAIVTDTLGWESYHEGTETVYFSPNGGFVFGNNGYADRVKARVFESPSGQFGRATKVILKFASKSFNSADPNSRLIIRYYGLQGFGQMSSGPTLDLAPGFELIDSISTGGSDIVFFTQFLYMNEVDTTGYTSIEATIPANAPVFYDKLAIGLDFTSLSIGDTVGLYSTTDGDGGEEEYVWDLTANEQWVTVQHPILGWDLKAEPAIFVAFEYEQDQPLDVRDENDLSFTISPNPARDLLNLQFKNQLGSSNSQLTITSMEGQLLKKVDCPANGTLPSAINISDLSSGMYVLRLLNENGYSARKFQVLH